MIRQEGLSQDVISMKNVAFNDLGFFGVALFCLFVMYYVGGYSVQFLFPQIFGLKNLQKKKRPKGQIRRDAFRSLGPLVTKALVWTVVNKMYRSEIGLVYKADSINVSEFFYSLFVILLLDVLHDAWFYFTHRLLHFKLLYHWIHYLHHESKTPSAFTGYSFHVLEAVLVFANEILLCFVIPIDIRLHLIYHLYTTMIHQGGHCGHEFSPYVPILSNVIVYWILPKKTWYEWTQRSLNTIQHHEMHHTHVRYHFSLYFTYWDRFLQTLHPSYDSIIRASKVQ